MYAHASDECRGNEAQAEWRGSKPEKEKYMNVLLISLGCDKNLVDSEVMLGALSEKGYRFTDDESKADAVVVNTCCFIGDAKEESINTILEMAELRKSGQIKALIVAGCLAQPWPPKPWTECKRLLYFTYPDLHRLFHSVNPISRL